MSGGQCLACSFYAFLGGQSSCRICESIWVKLALEKAFRQHDRKKCMNKKWENPIKINMLDNAHCTAFNFRLSTNNYHQHIQHLDNQVDSVIDILIQLGVGILPQPSPRLDRIF
jgi:hypothetical protein